MRTRRFLPLVLWGLPWAWIAPRLPAQAPAAPKVKVEEDGPAPGGKQQPVPPGQRERKTPEGARPPEDPSPPPREAGPRPRGVDRPEDSGELDDRVARLEELLAAELQALEEKLAELKARLLRERERSPRQPLDPGRAAPSSPAGPRRENQVAPTSTPEAPGAEEPAERERYDRLLARQEQLVKKWHELEKAAGTSRGAPGSAPPPPDEGREKQREDVRSELRSVLAEILDLRERSRERQLRRLRDELKALERRLDDRRSPGARNEAVDRRLRELLGR